MSRIFSFIVLLLSIESAAYCQTDFFWSDKALNEGAVNAPLEIELEFVEREYDLYLYFTTNGPSSSDISTGFAIDLELTGGNAHFISAETLNFDITVGGIFIGQRWEAFGATGFLSDRLVDELKCFSISSGQGIETNFGPVLVDEGYDVQADAFLVAKVRVFIGAFCGVDIVASVGDGLVVDQRPGSPVRSINPTFGCVSFCEPPFDGGPKRGIGKSCFHVSPLLGDVNLDGEVDLEDVSPIVQLLDSGSFQAEGDLNVDGVIDLMDVQGLVNVLTGRCPGAIDGVALQGDMDCSGCVDFLDISAYIDYLSKDRQPCDFESADLTGDGEVNLLDLNPFVEILLKR